MRNLYRAFTKHEVSVNYLGVLDDSITAHLIGLAETYTQSSYELKKVSKRVSFLIAESFQNIVRHGEIEDISEHFSSERDFFRIVFLPDRIIVASKNLIAQTEVDALNQKIDQVNNSTQSELNELWRKQLLDGGRTQGGGAGLGIIEMARKSGMQLQKKFIHVGDGKAQFFLGLEIIRKNIIGVTKLNIDQVILEYNKYQLDGLQLQYNGSLAKENTEFLSQLLKKNFDSHSTLDGLSFEMVSVMIEVLNNASEHGLRSGDNNDGIFAIYSDDRNQYIECGNYLHADNYEGFKAHLDHIKGLNPEELLALSLSQKAQSTSSDKVQLGLIELALSATDSFDYSFDKVKPDVYFFSLEIKLRKAPSA